MNWIECVVEWALEEVCRMFGMNREDVGRILSMKGEDIEEAKDSIIRVVNSETNRVLTDIVSSTRGAVLGLEGEFFIVETKIAHKMAIGCWIEKLWLAALAFPDRFNTKIVKRIENLRRDIEKDFTELVERTKEIYANNSAIP